VLTLAFPLAVLEEKKKSFDYYDEAHEMKKKTVESEMLSAMPQLVCSV
jgi:hypothetical protein